MRIRSIAPGYYANYVESQRIDVNMIADFKVLIDLFGLYILFSQYRSCDNTQEAWYFVLFIKMRACKHEYACMHSF